MPVLQIVAWAYPAVLAAALLVRGALTGSPGILSAWLIAPAQVAFLYAAVRMLGRVSLERWRFRGWCCAIVATLLDVLANGIWNVLAADRAVLFGTVADFVFDLNYVALVATCACFYVARGGRFRSRRSLVDALTLTLAAGAALLPFLLSPVFTASTPFAVTAASVGYTFGIGATAVMGALLYMQVRDWDEERPVAWILLAIVIVVCADLLVAAANLRDEFVYGGADVIASCTVYSALTTAVYAQYRPASVTMMRRPAGAHSFLPILLLFVATAIMLGAAINQAPGNMLLAAGMSLVASMLLVLRQFRVGVELERLNDELTAREAEALVSELVRRSSDVIAVIDADRRVRYVSPASLELLGRPAAALAGSPAVLLFGTDQEPTVRELLDRLGNGGARAEVELRLLVDDEDRVLSVTANDESANRLIEGCVLTIRDLTERRQLEAALLDIATRERQRLCGDIHEGLGQQLTGIGLYLKSMHVARMRDPAATAESLEPVISLVSGAIDQIRALARGLSPLEVVHRSLHSALKALAADIERQFAVAVRLDADVDGAALSDLEADHVYRIVQEALLNACRHGHATTIDVTAHVRAAQVTLVVCDDGEGMGGAALDGDGLGLRMMRYRVQLLGGTIRIETADTGGTRVCVQVRRRRLASA